MKLRTRRRLRRLRLPLWIGAIILGSASAAVFADYPGKLPNNTVLGNTSGVSASARPISAATTVNGQSCKLGATCTITATAGDIIVGTTLVSGGVTARVLYDNAGTLGEMTTTGSGTVLALATSPSLVTPSLGVAGATSINKVAITAPATSATLTIADGKTLTDTSGTGAVALKGATGGGFAQAACADLSNGGAGCTAGAASTSTAGIAKLHNIPVSIGWPAALNPNNTVLAVINQNSTISAIIGAVEVATGGAATVSVNKAPSGTACSAGTTLHSGSFNANGTAATNQTLTVTTSTLTAGDRLCLQTTGTTTWTSGTGIGTLTVFLAPTP